MKLIAGQRWMWDKFALVEIQEDSRQFDPETETVEVLSKRLNDSFSVARSWSFGKYYQQKWIYLEGQDRPKT